MGIRPYRPEDQGELTRLMGHLRVVLDGLKSDDVRIDPQAARNELEDCLRHKHNIMVHERGQGRLGGFIVCREVDGVTWAESLFVDAECRRKGIASALFRRAEEVAKEKGQETLYTWVHPNNDEVILFLRSQGYDFLNLIELRKGRNSEVPKSKVTVMNNEFSY